ncbi:CDP-alcohol phosphatidyltransferase family protein [Thermodesulfobacteriota bacterium]
MVEIFMISGKNRERYFKIISPVVDFFARAGIHPHVLSFAGFILSILAGVVYGAGAFFWAGWIVVIAGTCDAMDGLIARQSNKNSVFGAFLDSTLDRYSDMFLFAGLAYYFAGGHWLSRQLISEEGGGQASPWTVFAIIMVIAGSYMVSYARARAETLGIACKVGLMQRPERMVLLIIGSLLGAIPVFGVILLQATLVILAVTSNITALHRIFYVRNQIKKENLQAQ